MILEIPITKASTKENPFVVEYDTDWLLSEECPAETLLAALREGLKVLQNKKMTKVTGKTPGAIAEAKKIALANHEDIKAGRIRGVKKASKVSGEVKTEAMSVAKKLVKAQLKSMGRKVSLIKASEITRAAEALIEANPQIVKDAEAAVEARNKAAAGLVTDVLSSITEDVALIAKAAEAKKARKGATSAKQAGKVEHRARQ